jgi:hypothetical protein
MMMKARELLIGVLKHVAELVCLDEIEKPSLSMFERAINRRSPNTYNQPHIIISRRKILQKISSILSVLLDLLVGVHVVYLLCNLFYTYIIKYCQGNFN